MILWGRPVAQKIKEELKSFFGQSWLVGKKIKIFLFSEDSPSKVYVDLKRKFAQQVGLEADIVYKPEIDSFDEAYNLINEANQNSQVIWIIIQLPLNKHLQPFRSRLLTSVVPLKDIDWLGGVLFGLSQTGLFEFLPATPAAVIKILNFYNLDNFRWKKVLIIGQSGLVWAPLATYLLTKQAEVVSVNEYMALDQLIKFSKQADIIITATGQIHLVGERFVREDKSQIIIDVGWGIKDGKATWDVNIEKIKDKVKAYTPVPGGVGPVTVASLFENIKIIQEYIRPIWSNLSYIENDLWV